MTTRKTITTTALLLTGLSLLPLAGCDGQAEANGTDVGAETRVEAGAQAPTTTAATKPRAETPEPVQVTVGDDAATADEEPSRDAEIEPYRVELLELAYEAASAIRVEPHIEARSRQQQRVAMACIELGQLDRALWCINGIESWRRGSALADYASACVEAGERDVEPYLIVAMEIAAEAEDWRPDRIRAKVARARALLGQRDKAREISTSVIEDESHKIDHLLDEDKAAFEARLDAIPRIAADGGMDVVRNALSSSVRQIERHYEDEELRTRAIETIKSSWGSLPYMIRIELVEDLTQIALDHDDKETAIELIGLAHDMVEQPGFIAEFKVPLRGRVARLRALAGQDDEARAGIDAALHLFDTERFRIINMFRGKALRPVAEACIALGDTKKAREVYAKAIEEGMVNPNRRPRAVDLSQTCLSMALHGYEPDGTLLARIREIREGLEQP